MKNVLRHSFKTAEEEGNLLQNRKKSFFFVIKSKPLRADVKKNIDNPHSSLQAVCIYFLIIIIYVLLKKERFQALFSLRCHEAEEIILDEETLPDFQ